MAQFMMAMNINPSAKKEHRTDLAHEVSHSLDSFSTDGVKVEKLFATLGRYDYIALFEAPEQSVAFRIATEINAKGILETETWPVIPYESYSQLMG
jgi:uncharacterized protein with GYD domain